VSGGRVTLTLLGGFLGAGKSSWLRHQLRVDALRGAAVVLNEAADAPVDQVLLSDAASLHVLPGGCACCSGRPALLALLRELCDRRTAGQGQDAHVLETSGLADPAAILGAIRADPVLAHHIIVREVVVVVDALHGLAQLHEEALGRAQAEAADRLVIAKADAAPPEEVARLAATLRRLNPGAVLQAAVLGAAADLPEFDDVAPEPLAPPSGAGPLLATTLRLDTVADWQVFAVWLSALLHARGRDVARVKGVVHTPAGRLLLQAVRDVVQPPQLLPDDAQAEDDAVVVIGRGWQPNVLHRSLRAFAGAGSSRAEPRAAALHASGLG
jgi:G3E family GTPase